jgi:Uma2 family endonuclease
MRAPIIGDVSTALDISEVHRFSTEEYHQLIENGSLDDAAVELIDGLIVEMSPKGPAHENAVAWMAERLMDAVDRAAHQVRVAAALTLSDSEPEPDLMVIARDVPHPYHPATARLVVEISLSSLRRDLQQKVELYANAGIPEYWVVDLDGRRVIVHREPRAGAYVHTHEVGDDGALTSDVLQGLQLSVAELLAAAGS